LIIVGWVADACSGGFLQKKRTKQKNETQHLWGFGGLMLGFAPRNPTYEFWMFPEDFT
jgi:hypothetical protein